MNKKTKVLSSILLGFTLALTGCAGTKAEENHSKQKQEQAAKDTKKENKLTKGQKMAKFLARQIGKVQKCMTKIKMINERKCKLHWSCKI